jgi:hypothetical protein
MMLTLLEEISASLALEFQKGEQRLLQKSNRVVPLHYFGAFPPFDYRLIFHFRESLFAKACWIPLEASA